MPDSRASTMARLDAIGVVELLAIVEQRICAGRNTCSRQSCTDHFGSVVRPPVCGTVVSRVLVDPGAARTSEVFATAFPAQALVTPSMSELLERVPSVVKVMLAWPRVSIGTRVEAVLANTNVLGVLLHLLHVFGVGYEIEQTIFQTRHWAFVFVVMVLLVLQTATVATVHVAATDH